MRYFVANIVAEESEENAVNGLRTFNDRNGAVRFLLQWVYDDNINSTLPKGKTPYNQDDSPNRPCTNKS